MTAAPIVLALLSSTPAQELDTRLYRGEWEQVLGGLRKQLAATDGGSDDGARLPTVVLLARAQVTSNAYHLRDEPVADQQSAEALMLAEKGNSPGLLAEALMSRGRLLYWRAFKNNQWASSQDLFARAQKLYAQAKDTRGEAEALFYLGLVEQQQDHLDAGDVLFQKGLIQARSLKDGVLESFFHRHLAASAEDRGQLDEAEKGFVESLRLRLEGKACVLSPFAQITLADFYEKAKRSPEKIPRLLTEALATATRCGSNAAAIRRICGWRRRRRIPRTGASMRSRPWRSPSASMTRRWSRRPARFSRHARHSPRAGLGRDLRPLRLSRRLAVPSDALPARGPDLPGGSGGGDRGGRARRWRRRERGSTSLGGSLRSGWGSGTLALYRGLAGGRMSVVAPISGVLAAGLPALFGLAIGERPSLAAASGLVLSLPAVWLVSSGQPEERHGLELRAVIDGVLAGVGFAVLFIALQRAGRGVGLWPTASSQLASAVVVVAAAVVSKISSRGSAPPERPGWMVGWVGPIAAGVLVMVAVVCYFLATKVGLLSVVAVLTSLYPAVTVALAGWLLKEPIARRQGAGLALAGLAVGLISAG